jgi:hypothetical protein
VRRIRSVWKQGRGRKRRWRKWQSKVLHNLHFSNNISAEDISRKMRMVRHAEHMKNTYSILPYRFKGKKLGNTTTYNPFKWISVNWSDGVYLSG